MTKQGTWLAATLGILATMACVCGFAGRAKAQPAAEVKPSLPDADLTPQAFHRPAAAFVPAKSWYGYQLMLSDLASIAVMLTAGDALTGPVAAGLLLLAAPSVIHGMHGNDTMAVVSPVMRLLLGLVGAGLGASAKNCSHDESKLLDFCGVESGLAGMVVGMLVGGFVDYSLALQVVQPTNAARSSQSRVSLSNAGVAPIANGAAVVVGGRF